LAAIVTFGSRPGGSVLAVRHRSPRSDKEALVRPAIRRNRCVLFAPSLACTSEPARGVARNRVAPHAGFADVNALAKLPCIVVRVTLGNAAALLVGVLHFLRARRKAGSQCCQENEASQLHGKPSNRSLLNAPAPPATASGQAAQLISISQSHNFCQIVVKMSV